MKGPTDPTTGNGLYSSGDLWVVILAGGDGRRLEGISTSSGVTTPKQFWSVDGHRSLLRNTVDRARRIVPDDRVLIVVTEKHRDFFTQEMDDLPEHRVIVQPSNRGTATGILLGTMTILAQDPQARIVFLPSDHHVDEEEVVARSIREMADAIRLSDPWITLLGMVPDTNDADLGWIIASSLQERLSAVDRFVEKPDPLVARALALSGAVWNSFIFGATGKALTNLFTAITPHLAGTLNPTAVREDTSVFGLTEAYNRSPVVDFSRDLLQHAAERLRVLIVPPCGWTDLGTPHRVQRIVDRHRKGAAGIPGNNRPTSSLPDLQAAAVLLAALGTVVPANRANRGAP